MMNCFKNPVTRFMFFEANESQLKLYYGFRTRYGVYVDVDLIISVPEFSYLLYIRQPISY